MEWLQRLNKSIDYIEEHLADEIDLNKAAQIACCSTFHFQRMFSYLADVPLFEYIRRRKMTRAAFDLQSGNEKVIDISLKYGYDSPTAFNRAFQSVHGVAPSQAKQSNVTLKAFPPISFKISIKGEAEMNYKIEKKESFRIVGVKEHYLLNIEENFMMVPQFWQRTMQSGMLDKVAQLINKPPFAVLGVSTCMNGIDFDYYIAAPTDKEVSDGMSEYIVPDCTWAIFECSAKDIQSLQKRIVSEWLPTSGYEYADAPDIEVYLNADPDPAKVRCEVWLPITKK